MKLPNFIKSKKAVSPVLATVMLISLVVAASAMVYFLVVPMLRGSSDVDLLTVQWFDSDGDSVTDIAYVTLQNSGTASAIIKGLNVTITTDTKNETDILNAFIQGYDLPLAIDTTQRVDLVLVFDPTSNVEIGENIFRIRITYDNDLTSFAPDNLRHIDVIESLDLTVLNPINDSWVSGIIDPQAIAIGGFKTSAITYDFLEPDDSVILENQAITHNIDSTLYLDDDNYKIDFHVNDSLGQSFTIRRTFGIDNDDIGITFGVNSSIINPGDFLSASWSFTIFGAQLVNQTLVLGGDVLPYQQVFTSTEDTVTEYILTGSQTLQMAEDDLVFTLYVKDEAGNLNSAGEVVSLVDNLAPTTEFITPANNSYDLSGIITIEIYASDPTGIDTEFLDIYFFDLYSEYYYLYQQSVSGEATYELSTKSWVLEFNSFVLPNGNYSMEAIVYDTANIANAGYNNSIISIDNGVLEISGVIKGKGSPFVRGYLTFYLENFLPTGVNITQVNIDYDPDSRIGFIYDMVDNTDGTIWLSSAGSPYSEETNLPVQSGLGGVLSGGSKHKLTIRFDYKNRPDLCSFIISFYIEELGSWETIIIP